MRGIVTIVCLFIATASLAQGSRYIMTTASRSEFGFMVGGTHYIGDIHPVNPFREPRLMGGFLYKFALSYRMHLRANISYLMIAGNDSKSNNQDLVNRNLSFRSHLGEFAFGLEFNFMKYSTRNMRFPFTPYIFLQLGLSYAQPQARYGDEWVNLRTLGTEGQGGDIGGKYYSPVQMVIPMGIGFKVNMGQRASFAFEFGIRKTFTDYLDDVSGVYVNNEQLAAQNGDLAAALADPSLVKYGQDGTNNGYNRGNSNNKDWYGHYGVSLTFQLSRGNKCPFRPNKR